MIHRHIIHVKKLYGELAWHVECILDYILFYLLILFVCCQQLKQLQCIGIVTSTSELLFMVCTSSISIKRIVSVCLCLSLSVYVCLCLSQCIRTVVKTQLKLCRLVEHDRDRSWGDWNCGGAIAGGGGGVVGAGHDRSWKGYNCWVLLRGGRGWVGGSGGEWALGRGAEWMGCCKGPGNPASLI